MEDNDKKDLSNRNLKDQAEHALTDIGARTVTNEKGASVIRYLAAPIEKVHLLNLDFSDIERLTGLVREEILKKGEFQLWDLTISGYDEDPRALFEIPEVRKWFRQALEKAPHLLAIVSSAALRQIVFSLLDIQVTGHHFRSQIDVFEEQAIQRASVDISHGDPDQYDQVDKSLRTTVNFKILSTQEEFNQMIRNCLFSAYQFFGSCGLDHSGSDALASAVFPRIRAFLPTEAFPRIDNGGN